MPLTVYIADNSQSDRQETSRILPVTQPRYIKDEDDDDDDDDDDNNDDAGHDVNFCSDLLSRASEIQLSLAPLKLSPALDIIVCFMFHLKIK